MGLAFKPKCGPQYVGKFLYPPKLGFLKFKEVHTTPFKPSADAGFLFLERF